MIIKIVQKNGDKANHPILMSATAYFLRRLLTKEQLATIGSVKLIMVKNITDLGLCSDFINAEGKHCAELFINRKDTFPEIISTIAHELVHFGQTVDGRMVVKPTGRGQRWYWRGKYYGNDPYKNVPTDEHWKTMPWEREAYEKERHLAKAFFCKHYRENT